MSKTIEKLTTFDDVFSRRFIEVIYEMATQSHNHTLTGRDYDSLGGTGRSDYERVADPIDQARIDRQKSALLRFCSRLAA